MAEKKSSGGCLGTFFLVIIIAVVFGGCSACMHGGSSDNSSPKTHKVAKKEKPSKEQIEAKKIRAKNEKLHLKQLKAALTKLPDKTKGEIVEAKVENGTISITLSDATVSGTPTEIKQNTHNAWIIGNEYYNKYAPYPDSMNKLVNVYDEQDNLLGETSGWTGEYKFKGNVG